MNTDE